MNIDKLNIPIEASTIIPINVCVSIICHIIYNINNSKALNQLKKFSSFGNLPQSVIMIKIAVIIKSNFHWH